MDVATISKDNCCEFGKWLYGETKQQLGHLESYTECLAKHAMFHIEAGKVATAINDNRFTDAHAMLSTESGFVSASSAVGVAIMRLKKDVEQSSNSVIETPKKATRVVESDWEEF
jgi:methyl-accepting chemotaxis protein